MRAKQSWSIFHIKAITDPRFGENVTRFGGIRLDLLAQLTDEDAQVFGLFDVIAAPDRSEQRAMSENFIGVADEINEQVVFFRRQMQLFAMRFDHARFEINLEIAGLKSFDLKIGDDRGAP